MKWFGVVNLLLGTMAVFVAVEFALFIAFIQTTMDPTQLYAQAAMSALIAATGILSGIGLFREKAFGRPACLLFALCLLLHTGLAVATDQLGMNQLVLAVYGFVLLGVLILKKPGAAAGNSPDSESTAVEHAASGTEPPAKPVA